MYILISFRIDNYLNMFEWRLSWLHTSSKIRCLMNNVQLSDTLQGGVEYDTNKTKDSASPKSS